MDDKKILEKIKNSAEDVEIPESLSPEEIQKRLEEQNRVEKETGNVQQEENNSKPKKVIPIRRYGVWAAAAVLLCMVGLRVAPVLQKAEAEKAKVQSEVQTEASDSAIPHMESYEALYDMIKTYEESRIPIEEDMEYSAERFLGKVSVEDSMMMADGQEISQEINYEEAVPEESVIQENSDADYSQTNTQEENVDEADIVKTDGTYLYCLDREGTIRIVEAESMTLTGMIEAAEPDSDCLAMYVSGDVLQMIWGTEEYVTYQEPLELPEAEDSSEVRSYYSRPARKTVVETYDISDRKKPEKIGVYTQDGTYLSSRKNGKFLYVFTSYSPKAGESPEAREYYVPKAGEEFLPYENIYLPVQEKNMVYDGKCYLVASSLEDSAPEKARDCMAVVSGGETFYVSENHIYAATEAWDSGETKTDIVRFGYENGTFLPGCGGRIPGSLHNSFSMNEYQGNLRVVATVDSWEETTAASSFSKTNSLYVLNKDLQIIGKVENLAEGEEIKSARFMGETGYFVTYRNTDPLFSVDLSDPEHPKILGELKITGFSEYLHFYGTDRLLGLGWETDPETGVTEGLKCSMFDLSDPADVKESDRLVLEDIWVCDGLWDYKAILAEPEKNIFGFAYGISGVHQGAGETYQENSLEERYYYAVLSYTEEGFVPLKYLKVSGGKLFPDGMDYRDYRSLRGVYIGDIFYLVSNNGIESYDMTKDFAPENVLIWTE